MFEFRYSNMLAVLSVTFLYSSAMPILYILASWFFLLTYWIDKWLLFRYYRKPVMFNTYLPMQTARWFKFAFICHVIGFLCTYSNSDIIPLPFKYKKNGENYVYEDPTQAEIT